MGIAALVAVALIPSSAAADVNGGEPIGGSAPGSPGAVTVPASTPTPSTTGQWQVLPYNVPGLAIHATVMNDGRVLLVEGSGNNPAQFAAGTFNVWVWNPQTGTFTTVPRIPTDLFCSGHAVLPNGKVLFVGGTAGYPTTTREFYLSTRTAYEFDPATNSFTRDPDLTDSRWYPSLLERGNGSILAVSGSNDTNGWFSQQAESFNPSLRSWTQLPGRINLPLYPALTLLQDGRLFYSGTAWDEAERHEPGVWDTSSNAFTSAGPQPGADRRNQAASVLLPPAQSQRIGVFGGGNDTISAATVDLYDLSNPNLIVHAYGLPLATPKMHVLGVILPDETVFETGGGKKFAADPVLEAATFNPANGSWTQMSPPTVPRTYHSEGILLPDGRVATLGSNPTGFQPEVRIEVFSPPYLFKGPRPTISTAPSAAAYGATYTVNVGLAAGATLSKLVLIKPASVTHSNDPNQRLVEMPFTGAAGAYRATLPTNTNLTPPGSYMLFALDNSGRPSVAKWVRVG